MTHTITQLKNHLYSVQIATVSWAGDRYVPIQNGGATSLDALAKSVAEKAHNLLSRNRHERLMQGDDPPEDLYGLVKAVEALYGQRQKTWGGLTRLLIWLHDFFSPSLRSLKKAEQKLENAYPSLHIK